MYEQRTLKSSDSKTLPSLGINMNILWSSQQKDSNKGPHQPCALELPLYVVRHVVYGGELGVHFSQSLHDGILGVRHTVSRHYCQWYSVKYTHTSYQQWSVCYTTLTFNGIVLYCWRHTDNSLRTYRIRTGEIEHKEVKTKLHHLTSYNSRTKLGRPG